MALFCMVHLINHISNGLQMFFKIIALKNLVTFTGKNLCWSRFLIQLQAFSLHSNWILRDTGTERYSYQVRMWKEVQQLCLKETPTQVCSCEYCKIFKNSYLYRMLVAVSKSRGVLRNQSNIYEGAFFVKCL